jgi:hypothetical protein
VLRAYYLKAYILNKTIGPDSAQSLIGGHEVSLTTILNAYGVLRSRGMNDQQIYEFLERALLAQRDHLTAFEKTSRKSVAAVIGEALKARSEARATPQSTDNREDRVKGEDLVAFLDSRAHEFYGEREAKYGNSGIHVMVHWGGSIFSSATYEKGPEGRRIKFGDIHQDIGKRVIRKLLEEKKDFDPQRFYRVVTLPSSKEYLGLNIVPAEARSEARAENVFSLKAPVVFSIEAGDLAELKNWPELLASASFNPRKLFVAVTGRGNARSEARVAELSHFVNVLRDEQLSSLPKNAPVFHFGNMVENADAVRARISTKFGRDLRALLGIAPGSFLLPGLLLDEQVSEAVLARRGGFLFDDGRFTGRFLEMLFQGFEVISASA